MRALTVVALSALAGLWGWYGLRVAPVDAGAPVPVAAGGTELSGATLNNQGVRLARAGRPDDALAYLERAHAFRPLDETIGRNLRRWRASVLAARWRRLLEGVSAVVGVLLAVGWLVALVRRARDRRRLRRVRLRNDPWIRIEGDRELELPLRFSEPLRGLLSRHPLTIVWSCASQGKHMRSQPPVRVDGRRCTVELNRDRVERLRQHPGNWRGFLYLGKTPVGEAAARVG